MQAHLFLAACHLHICKYIYSLYIYTVNKYKSPFLARDVIYKSRADAIMSVSVCLSVTEVHCGCSACQEE